MKAKLEKKERRKFYVSAEVERAIPDEGQDRGIRQEICARGKGLFISL